MKFGDWVREQGYGWRQAGAAIGCSASEAWHYANGRLPRPEKVVEIFHATARQVTPLDWYGLTPGDLAAIDKSGADEAA